MLVDRGMIEGAARQRDVSKDRQRRMIENIVKLKSEVNVVMIRNVIGKSRKSTQ